MKGRAERWPIAVLVLVLVLIAGGVLWSRSHPRRTQVARMDRIAAGLSVSALAESVNAAHARHDWSSAVRWGKPLADRAPRNSVVLRALAIAIHNVSFAGAPTGSGVKPPLRNSLQRTRYDHLAIALMDSSRACATNLDDWTRAERYLGNFYEILGLPLEALERYEAILVRAPDDSVALARRYWVATHLVDPRATDFPTFESRADPLPNRVRRSRAR